MDMEADALGYLEEFSRRGELYGHNGSPEDVITNAYYVEGPSRQCTLDFVDVNIVQVGAVAETRIRKEQNRSLMNKAVRQLQNQWGIGSILYAYDDEKTLVFVNTTIPIARHETTIVKVTEPGRGADGLPTQIEYDITLKITKKLLITDADFRPIPPGTPEDERMTRTRRTIECIQALNLLLREALTDPNTRRGDKPNLMVVSLQDKIFANIQEEYFKDATKWRSIWQGFTAALNVSKKGLVLKADLTHSVFFRECSLADAIGQMANIFPLNANSKVDPKVALKAGLASTLKSRLVSFQTADGEAHASGVITKVLYRPAAEQFVADGDDTKVLETYERHNQRLQYPNLGCVEITEAGYMYRVPYEKVMMKNGQRYNKMLNKQEQAVFIRAVSLSPDRRIGAIAHFMDLSNVRQHPLLQAIGLSIEASFMGIKARVLPQPELEYGSGSNKMSVVPTNGQWNMPRGARYQEPAQPSDDPASRGTVVVVVYPRRDGRPCVPDKDALGFVKNLIQEGRSRGMNWNSAVQLYEMPAGDWRSQDREMMDHLGKDVVQKMKPGFVFAIFDRGADRMYSDFKSGMDNYFGIPSQGLLCDTVLRNPRGAVENIMYKVNVKFGGNNNVLTEETLMSLKLCHRLFMVVGISLSHGKTKDDKAKSSYAGFVGSMDDSFMRWSTENMSVESNEALLPDISEQMVRLLTTYKENVGRFPEVMVVYRDGVTRTHENELHRNDIRCLRRAFEQLNIRVELVFIVVNKMHRTRFFRRPNTNSMGEPTYSKDNIQPGLVVDDVVVDPFGDDFYLASHRGLLGTSRPIRYHILINEDTTTTPDDIQGLTMSLCYTYQRCNMGVSIPAPLYYANLAAARCAVLADSIIRSHPDPPPPRGDKGNFRGGRQGGRADVKSVPTMSKRLLGMVEEGIQQHPTLKKLKRLSYI